MILNIPIKKIYEDTILPTRGSEDAAGYDLYAHINEPISILPHEKALIGSGIAVAVPKGTYLGIFARSGLANKFGCRPSNCVGVIDADYRGQLLISVRNDTSETQTINPKERIAQAILMPFIEMDFNETENLPETKRGSGGFGSTGTK